VRVVVLCAALAGCAGEPREAPIDPSTVSAPAWATPAEASASALPPAKHEPVSLGSDQIEPKHTSAKRIDLDVVGADLPNVCRLIGELAGVNIVVAGDVTGTVTVKMKNVPWSEALDAILLSKGYRAERVGNVVVVRK
jgi:type IV pilus assembly protein PilQ